MQPTARLKPWGVLARRHPSAFLLAAQLLSLLVHPLMDQSLAGRWLFGAVALVVVPLALWVVGRSPLVNWIAWLLAVPAILLTLAGVASGQQDLLVASALLAVHVAEPAPTMLALKNAVFEPEPKVTLAWADFITLVLELAMSTVSPTAPSRITR